MHTNMHIIRTMPRKLINISIDHSITKAPFNNHTYDSLRWYYPSCKPDFPFR